MHGLRSDGERRLVSLPLGGLSQYQSPRTGTDLGAPVSGVLPSRWPCSARFGWRAGRLVSSPRRSWTADGLDPVTQPGPARPVRAAHGLLVALVGLALLLAAVVVGAVPAAAQNAVGSSTPAVANTVGSPASIGAGQRLGRSLPQPRIVVATSVAADTVPETRVFWSGGQTARTAAEKWASESGVTTLEMSPSGEAATRARRDHGRCWGWSTRVTLLHQHQRPRRTETVSGRQVTYVETTLICDPARRADEQQVGQSRSRGRMGLVGRSDGQPSSVLSGHR